MHKLLARQLAKFQIDAGSPPDRTQWQGLVAALDRCYTQFDRDRNLLEHSMELASHEMQLMYQRLQTENIAKLEQSYAKLSRSLEGTIAAIAKAVEARDPYTAGHQHRVAKLSEAIALEMGLDEEIIKGIHLGASIHDIGIIHLPAEILVKPARLTETEYLFIKVHPDVGFAILRDIDFPWPVAEIAHQHHERMDGSGYPQGLKGDAILLQARIVGVADVVEAMLSHRPYRPALGLEAAMQEISEHSGTKYDSQVVSICMKLFMEKDFRL